VKSERQLSAKGNAMAKLQLRFWDKEGKAHFVFDYLVFSEVNLCIRKVKHFCDAVGLAEQYAKGEIPEELELFCGKLQLGTQEEKPNPNGGVYPMKNIVVDYVKSDGKKAGMKPLPAKSDDNFDDVDLPF